MNVSDYVSATGPVSSIAIAASSPTLSPPNNNDDDISMHKSTSSPPVIRVGKINNRVYGKRRKSNNHQNNNNHQHAYFASSEEESEAELDEHSHSSRDASSVAGMGSMIGSGIGAGSSRGGGRASSLRSRTAITTVGPIISVVQPDPAATLIAAGGILLPSPPKTVTVAAPSSVASSASSPEGSNSNGIGGGRSSELATAGGGGGGVATKKMSGSYSSPRKSGGKRRKRNRYAGDSRHHTPRGGLPVFQDPRSCMWTSTHDANAPSEDRYSSLVNILLRPPKTQRRRRGDGSRKDNDINNNNTTNSVENNNKHTGGGMKSGSSCDGESIDPADHDAHDEENNSLIRLSLWSVIDGHGGGCVATYAAEVLLPHIAASVARALKSDIVDRGVCNVNGQLRDANALDLDGLIRSSDRSRYVGSKSQVQQREAGIDVVNPNSIHYRSPYEDSESEEGDVGIDHEEETTCDRQAMRSESESEAESEALGSSVASSLLPKSPIIWTHGESVSSVKTSLKTNRSPATLHAPVGTHSPAEVAALTRAVIDSFLAVDEGWINSIDPVTTHQTSCVSNGRWNAGACALVVFTVQRLDWFKVSDVDRESPYHRDLGASGFDDTSHNKDAERRRMLDRGKSCGSWSTLSSTSSITTAANTAGSLHVDETEDDEASQIDPCRRRINMMDHDIDNHHLQEGVFIGTPPGCEGHYFYPQDAMLYTAHVGDCRAVMLGSAPPRTIKVPPDGDSLGLNHADISEDESCSETVADEISSSEHDSDSSGDDTMMEDDNRFVATTTSANGLGRTRALGFVRRTSKRQRRNETPASEEPFVPLPPLNQHDSFSEESVIESDAVESDDSASTTSLVVGRPSLVFNTLSEEEKMSETEDEDELKEIRSVRSGSPTQMDRLPSPTQLVSDVVVHPSPLPLSLLMRPIDLTTDHSAYNPAEVTAVLRRCNNAPKAISSASSGGIKRVAGSLAVTRALGDAYLKTPRLSFFPYKRHAPYITARPEVNCRVLTKGADRILTLASDGVWERASGEDVLRWVRNYYNSRIVYDEEDEQHHVYGDPTPIIPKRVTNEEESLASGVVDNDTAEAVVEKSSIEDTDQKVKEGDATGFILCGDDKLGDSDGTSTYHASPTTITANETTTPPVTVIKRKHSEIASAEDDSVSSHLDSSIAGVGISNPTSRLRVRSFSTPNVADVIVRKVLSKVSKSRNTSLRMLRSLPKGRARRSKHDDITATVVDLSVSMVTRYYLSQLRILNAHKHSYLLFFINHLSQRDLSVDYNITFVHTQSTQQRKGNAKSYTLDEQKEGLKKMCDCLTV